MSAEGELLNNPAALEAAKINAALNLLMDTATQEGAEEAARSAATVRLSRLGEDILTSLTEMGLWPVPAGVGGIAQALGHAQIELMAAARGGAALPAASAPDGGAERVVELTHSTASGEGMYL